MQYNHYMRTDFEPDRWQPIYVISDIHGNLTALETFLKKVKVNPRNIICLGDVIDYGPNSVKCLQMIFDADIFMIAGNHERLLTDHELRKLLEAFSSEKDIRVEIETNGSVPIRYYKERDNRLTMTMDYKLPSSNMEENMCLENMEYLKPWDVVKFVIGSREDLNRAKEIIERFRLCEKAIVYFSPVFGKIEPEEIVEFMKENKLNKVRFQIQIHKVVWDPDKTGV